MFVFLKRTLANISTPSAAVDVNIYASDPKAASALVGNHENTEVGRFLRDYLDLDVEAIAAELRNQSRSFTLEGAGGERLDWLGYQRPQQAMPTEVELDHYRGDFKKRSVLDEDCGCGEH